MTHDYYHVALLVLVALGLAALVQEGLLPLAERLRFSPLGHLLAAAVLVMGLVGPWSVRSRLADPTAGEEARRLERVGRDLGVATRVVSLGQGYGFPLTYRAWLLAVPWPYRIDLEYERLQSGEVLRRKYRLESLREGFHPAYFVVTDPSEWAGQPGLEGFLRERYPLVAERPEEGLWIFDLSRPL
jgi:hypothetical protein